LVVVVVVAVVVALLLKCLNALVNHDDNGNSGGHRL
jgi:hypothetical protein